MKSLMVLTIIAALGTVAQAQSKPEGKWLDVSRDAGNVIFFGSADSTKVVLSEDYEVLQTHAKSALPSMDTLWRSPTIAATTSTLRVCEHRRQFETSHYRNTMRQH